MQREEEAWKSGVVCVPWRVEKRGGRKRGLIMGYVCAKGERTGHENESDMCSREG